jgi:hypothetical protein
MNLIELLELSHMLMMVRYELTTRDHRWIPPRTPLHLLRVANACAS